MTLVKKLGVVLVASLAINLFLGGMLVAHWLRQPDESARPAYGGRGAMPLLARAGEALGDPRHPRIRELMRAHREQIRAKRNALRQARREVESTLSAKEWDEARVRRSLGDLRGRTTESQAALHEALVELARDMTPEQRARLARPASRPGLAPGAPGGRRPRLEPSE